jgi:hypothetical protein
MLIHKVQQQPQQQQQLHEQHTQKHLSSPDASLRQQDLEAEHCKHQQKQQQQNQQSEILAVQADSMHQSFSCQEACVGIGCVASSAFSGRLAPCISIQGAVAWFKTAGKTSINCVVNGYAETSEGDD